MSKLFITVALLLNLQTVLAMPIEDPSMESYSTSITRVSTLVADHDLLGEEGVVFFQEILKSSHLYALLLALDSELPDVTRAIEYVGLFNEIHLMNQQLGALIIEMQKNNQLLTTIISQSKLI